MRRCPRCLRSDPGGPDDEGTGTCAACGTELVTERPATVAALPSYTELVKVYEAKDDAERDLVRALLEGADVPVFAYGEPLAGAGSSGIGALMGPRKLLVPVAFERKAREALTARGVIRAAPTPSDEMAPFWRAAVVPLLAGPFALGLARDLALRSEALRAAVFASLEAAGPRGLTLLADLALAFAAGGPREAAREAAGALATSEAFRDRRAGHVLSLGALVLCGADKELAARVTASLERFRGSPEAERALVPLLDHEDAEVRDAAIEALFSVSGGETLGYEPDASPETRKAAVARWRERTGGRPQ